MIERPRAGDYLVLHPYLPTPFDIPIFFEPLEPVTIEHVGLENGRIAIVLDGDRPLGRQWIVDVRWKFQMLERNTRHFGQHPYYYACRDYNRVGNQVQYLVYTQGAPDPIPRWRIALAMLRQWCAKCVSEHGLNRIKPKYFVEDAAPLSLTRSLSS
ncbi:MAG: hypothetical protein WA777_21640 [Rhodanobacter sp.]